MLQFFSQALLKRKQQKETTTATFANSDLFWNLGVWLRVRGLSIEGLHRIRPLEVALDEMSNNFLLLFHKASKYRAICKDNWVVNQMSLGAFFQAPFQLQDCYSAS